MTGCFHRCMYLAVVVLPCIYRGYDHFLLAEERLNDVEVNKQVWHFGLLGLAVR